VTVYTVLLPAAYGSVTVINRQLQNQPTIPPVGLWLYAVRRQEARVTARRLTGLGGREMQVQTSRGGRRVETSPSISRVSLTRYRLSQRRYGIVDNNGDFSLVRRDGGACRPARVDVAPAATDSNTEALRRPERALTGCNTIFCGYTVQLYHAYRSNRILAVAALRIAIVSN